MDTWMQKVVAAKSKKILEGRLEGDISMNR